MAGRNLGLFLILSLIAGMLPPAPVAQAASADWQRTATGLIATRRADRRTAGLGFEVKTDEWPMLSLRGGVQDAGWGKIWSAGTIQLGALRLPGSAGSIPSDEVADWSHSEMTFGTTAESSIKLWVSRLSPAVLLNTSARALRLFTGPVAGSRLNGGRVEPRPAAPTYPRYVAFSSGGDIRIQPLGASPTSLTSLDQNWVLLWYGSNSHFLETKRPLSYTGADWAAASMPHSEAYQGDAPILLVFENRPMSIGHSSEGGVELAFNAAAGHLSILPLFGRDHPRAGITEGWAAGLPQVVESRARWWASHLCSFPVSAEEEYAYDASSDTATIRERFQFLRVCSGGSTFSPLPPMLGLARSSLGVTFSGSVVDANLSTEFGPTLGLENATEYSWSVSGLGKLADAERVVSESGQAPAELEARFASELGEMLQAGHLAPWIFADSVPRSTWVGGIYWLSPADTLYHLTEMASIVPEDLKPSYLAYLRAERTAYPPETLANLPLGEGKPRAPYVVFGQEIFDIWKQERSQRFYAQVPLFNLYALAGYYATTGDALDEATWQKAQEILDRSMQEQDWATFYWFQGYQDRRVAVENANRHLAGMIGYVRLAERIGDAASEAVGRALLAKAAALRLGMQSYPRYLYAANLVELPSGGDWQVRQTAGNWIGHLFNYQWTGPNDDARQMIVLDQFRTMLYDHSGLMEDWAGWKDYDLTVSAYLPTYRDMVPEVGRLLAERGGSESSIYLNKVKALFPHWYAAYAEGTLGMEHNLSRPIDSFQIFMAEVFLEQKTSQELARWVDVPWLLEGDLFYLHKLAEALKAFRGVSWVDPSPPGPGTTFADVAASHPYYAEIESLYRAGYTAGCATSPLRYCPDQAMNRAESAVFVERGVQGTSYTPPQPASQTFADLPLASWAAGWVQGLYFDGYTAGCATNPLLYCPWQGHTRAEAAVFYLRMLHGKDYAPPVPIGMFSDVPTDTWYARWAEAAYNAGLIPACGSNPLRYCPEDPLSRGLAAYMMVQAKSLP